MSLCTIDHFVITAPTLEYGAAFVKEALGVIPQVGGRHPRMGTHNLLLRLGDALYLEVIAVDPAAETPERPRWFDLDSLVSTCQPTLATWVARTRDVTAAVEQSSEDFGPIVPMSRGDLNWLITIPGDGSLPLEGVAPTLIEWHTQQHPAAGLQDHGLNLVGLDIYHPQTERVSDLVKALDLVAPLTIIPAERPHLVARIKTQHGLRSLPFSGD